MLESRGEAIGRATNNVAEYRALLLGIELARELGAREVDLVGDSELIVKQVKGEYRVKDADLRPLHAEVRAALGGVRALVDPPRAPRAQRRRRPPRQRNTRRGGRLGAPGDASPIADLVHYPRVRRRQTRRSDRPRGSASATSTSRSPTSTARSTSTCGVLGFELQQRWGEEAAFVSAGGYHHHIGLNTWESRAARRRRRGPPGSFTPRSSTRPGARWPTRCGGVREAGIPLDGASDHGVSEALYLRDPDQNGVELYWDRPQEEWPRDPRDPEGVAMFTAPLDLADLLAELDG